MATSLQDWLGPLVESELAAVLRWNDSRGIKREPGTEHEYEDEERFADDGSNFLSTIGSPPLTAESNKLQIVKVLALDFAAIVLLSDGFTSIRATLSVNALAALESELDEKLSLEMKGDVICLEEVTVTSTPYGTSDGFVQLRIKSLEYQYSLRKTPKDSVPIEQRGEVVKLLKQITEHRSRPKHYQEDEVVIKKEQPAEPTTSPKQLGDGASHDVHGIADRGPDSRIRTLPEPGDGASLVVRDDADISQTPQRLHDSQPRSSPKTRPASLRRGSFSTQISGRKNQRGPTLGADGFETQMAINLARPTTARMGTEVTSYQPRVARQHAAVSTDTSRLLGLMMGKEKAQPSRSTSPKPAPSEPIEIEEDTPIAVDLGTRRAESSEVLTELQSRPQAVPASSHPALSRTPRPTYARRRPSQKQRSILDQPQSWFPSLPGRTFPSPNVPVQLLNQWNSEASAIGSTTSQCTPTSHTQQTIHDHDADEPASASSMDASERSASSDSDLRPSQWSQSPPRPAREQLPPDSSAPTGSAKQRGPVYPDNHRLSPASAMNRVTPGLPDRSSGLATGAKSKPFSQMHRHSSIQSGPTSRQASPRKLATHTLIEQGTLPPNSSAASTESTTARRPPAHPRWRHPLPAKPPPPSSAAETVIEGTQVPTADDEMELDVPRPLPDPALAHRKRRKEHFREAQLQEWLKANYVVEPTPEPYIKTVRRVLAVYRMHHRDDPMEWREMSGFVAKAFPNLTEPTLKSLRHKVDHSTATPSPAQAKVSVPRLDPDPTDRTIPADAQHCKSETGGDLRPRSKSSISSRGSRKEKEVSSAPAESKLHEDMHDETPSRNERGSQARRSSNVPQAPRRTQASYQTAHLTNGISKAPDVTQPAKKQDHELPHHAQPRPRPSSSPLTAATQMQERERAAQGPKPPTTVFQEFAHAWTHTQPGGAFAQEREQRKEARWRASNARIDVLGWEV